MRIVLAFRVFLGVLFSRTTAERVVAALESEPAAPSPRPAKVEEKSKAPARSEALIFLAALQREARFVDFVMESLEGLSNEQIGAAARDVHRDCGAVIQRMFGLEPLLGEPEQSAVEVPAGFDSARYRLTGNVSGEAPYRGRLMHPGWKASKCEVPKWSGSKEASGIIAPAEVDIA